MVNNFQRSTFSTANKKRGILARLQGIIYSIFGANDDTPRGIQERKDMCWVVLASTHRRLRMENQKQQYVDGSKDSPGKEQKLLTSPRWQEESNEQIKQLMEEAVSHLDDKTDIGDMPLKKLRREIQTLLEPQIIHLLNVAHDVEESMNDEDDEYVLSEEEEKEYKEILSREHDQVCQLLEERNVKHESGTRKERTGDPVPFYEMKKNAIETLLSYYDWWPKNGPNTSVKSSDKDYVDEFGFSPNHADSEIVPAMRYYHVRNLVRSTLARRASINKANESYHSLVPLQSTIPIPSSGRGVFVDGFAPAGTLLAFIPGKVWPKEHLQSASLQTQLQFQNDPRHQLSMRYDDILIDSRHSPYTVVKNMWSLGHIINHPPAPKTTQTKSIQQSTPKIDSGKGESEVDQSMNSQLPHQGPNCVTVPINFTDNMFEGEMNNLRDYLPNEYELPPKPGANGPFEKDETFMHGMGLVALRDVKDEELFYDYRLSPDEEQKKQGGGSQYPAWYYVWDREAVHNRWNNDS